MDESLEVGLANGAIASLCCLISGYWLSPDVDVKGYLKRRYGVFRFIWHPYYSLSHAGGHYRVNGKGTHRSHLSHSPLIGTASKVLYLGAISALVLGHDAMKLPVLSHLTELMWAAIGLEVGATVHYIADLIWSELH
jgi:uncharacterized metal-binding protein